MAVNNDKYWLEARDKTGLLVVMMKTLAGSARIAFEGDLSGCDFSGIAGASRDETTAIKRGTLRPKLDFIVLPLEPDTIQPILDQVLPDGRVVHEIIHVQIEKAGQHEFGAFDNFHPECIGCGAGVPVSLLEELVAKGILRSFELAR